MNANVRGDRILNTRTGRVVEGGEIVDEIEGDEYDFLDDYDYWARWRSDLERSYGRM